MLGQKLLEAVFGDQAVRSLAERARTALEARVRDAARAERARYTDLLDSLGLDAEAPEQLRAGPRGSTTCGTPASAAVDRDWLPLGS